MSVPPPSKMMRRTRTPPAASSFRALAQAGAATPSQGSVSSLLRSFNVETNPTRPVRPSPLTASTIPDMPLDLLDRIRSFPLFLSAPDDFLAAVGAHLRPQVHAAHDIILNEGDEAKAMYWLVRGVVAVTSRDGEAVYAELKPGAFFGEIGVLMNIPRTATIVARTKCLLVVLKREALQAELPSYPDMEQAIRQEAQERMAILAKKRREMAGQTSEELVEVVNTKKRKSPSPGALEDPTTGGSAFGSGTVSVRKTLRELPLFETLPGHILHFLGLSAQPKTYPPFTDIIRQGTPGHDLFFIVRGEAEVVREEPAGSARVRPRLGKGQYFGEVSSLGLSNGRTATVRSITTVECLVVGGESLEELWRRCPPEIKSQVEATARRRFGKHDSGDKDMADAEPPRVTFTTTFETQAPSDPDPFRSVDMENLRTRRRNSMAPPLPLAVDAGPCRKPYTDEFVVPAKRARTLPRRTAAARDGSKSLPDEVLVAVFGHLDVLEMLRLRAVCSLWRRLLCESPKLCARVDLSPHNRIITDGFVAHVLAPFLGERPRELDVGNCFHLTDEGFEALWRGCGRNVRVWKMRSVWDVSAGQILDMSERAKGLEEVDWSNCRKVGDNLLARVVGWVVPEPPPNARKLVLPRAKGQRMLPARSNSVPMPPPPGTVIGCPNLRRLNLSYCKHITDRSMAHLAAHASHRLESLTLTRCTSITDAGFQAWTPYRFQNLTHLCLADCTYLSDHSIIGLVNAAKNLTHLDLSFCCALSDTATEVLALGLPGLRELRMAFCGSAVSDASLGCVALHLNELRGLSVRGCVRVTGLGIENVLEGCAWLSWIDVSQCKNLAGWLAGAGWTRWGFDERVEHAAEGWQVPPAKPASRARGRNHKALPGTVGMGPVLRPVIPPAGVVGYRARKPVRFVVEKGAGGLR